MIKKKEKIITFGEIMLRLSTPDHQTINQTHSYLANYGGGEANVAVLCLIWDIIVTLCQSFHLTNLVMEQFHI